MCWVSCIACNCSMCSSHASWNKIFEVLLAAPKMDLQTCPNRLGLCLWLSGNLLCKGPTAVDATTLLEGDSYSTSTIASQSRTLGNLSLRAAVDVEGLRMPPCIANTTNKSHTLQT